MKTVLLSVVMLLSTQTPAPAPPTDSASQEVQLMLLDSQPLAFAACPEDAPDASSWQGFHNRLTVSVNGILMGHAGGHAFASWLLGRDLCPKADEPACLVSFRYEFSRRNTLAEGDEAVLRVAFLNRSGRTIHGLAYSREPGATQRYWIRDGKDAWQPVAVGTETELHRQFYAALAQLAVTNPSRPPVPKGKALPNGLIKG